MFRRNKHDKIQKTIETLRAHLRDITSKTADHSSAGKCIHLYEEIYSTFTSSEALSKQELFNGCDVLFASLGSASSAIQIQADQTINKIFRMYYLKGHIQKIIALLLNELNHSFERHWKSVSVTLNKLAYYVRYVNATKGRSYVYCFLNSMAVIIKRPEDGIQSNIVKTFPVIINSFGGYLCEQTFPKEREVLEYGIKNLELGGSSGRAACVVVSELCKQTQHHLDFSIGILKGVLNEPMNQQTDTRKVVNTLVTFRYIWPLICAKPSRFHTLSIQKTLLCAAKLLQLSSNEITVATLETIESVFSINSIFLSFVPADIFAAISEPATPLPVLKASGVATNLSVSNLDDTYSWGSSNDISIGGPVFFSEATSLAGTEDVDDENGDEGSSDSKSVDVFVDPLSKTAEQVSEQSPNRSVVKEAEANSNQYWLDGILKPFGAFLVNILVRRFLLSQENKIICDDSVRISHKVLAVKCLSAIVSNHQQRVLDVCEKMKLSEIYEYVGHDDEQLSVAAFGFFIAVQGYSYYRSKNVDLKKFMLYFQNMTNTMNPLRVKGSLDALKTIVNLFHGNQYVTALLMEFCLKQSSSSYFLVQIARLELLAAIRWEDFLPTIRQRYQSVCLQAIIAQLGNSDIRIRNAAITNFLTFFKNIVLDCPQVNDVTADLSLDFSINFLNRPSKRLRLADEDKICYVMNELTAYSFAAAQMSDNSMALVVGIEALLSLGDSIQWLVVRSIGSALLPKLLTYASMSLSLDELTTVMEVISKIVCLKPGVQHQITTQAVLVYLRVLNLYYTVYSERIVNEETNTITQSLLSNVVESPRRHAESRAFDISYLVGTGLRPCKGGNYHESPTLKLLESIVKGSYKNYVELLEEDADARFLNPLKTAFYCLERVLSIFDSNNINPFFHELMLYVNRLIPFCVAPATALLSRLLRVIFKQDCQALKTYAMVPASTAASHNVNVFYNDLNLPNFLATLTEPTKVDQLLFSRLLLNRFHKSQKSRSDHTKLVEVLKNFEHVFSFVLASMFSSNNFSDTRPRIIEFLSILLLESVEYKLADPHKKILDFCFSSLKSPSFDTYEILPNLLYFLITLSTVDSNLVRPEDLEALVLSLHENLAFDKKQYAFSCIALWLLYNIAQGKNYVKNVCQMVVDNTEMWLSIDAKKVFEIWILVFACSRQHRDSLFQHMSAEFIRLYCEYFVNESYNEHDAHWNGTTLIWSTYALCSCSDTAFTPFDHVCHFIEHANESQASHALIGALPLLAVLTKMNEERLLLRLSSTIDSPTEALSRITVQSLITVIELHTGNQIDDTALSFATQLILLIIRSERRVGLEVSKNLVEIDFWNFVADESQSGANFWTLLLVALKATQNLKILDHPIIAKTPKHNIMLPHLVVDVLQQPLSPETVEDVKRLNDLPRLFLNVSTKYLEHLLQSLSPDVMKIILQSENFTLNMNDSLDSVSQNFNVLLQLASPDTNPELESHEPFIENSLSKLIIQSIQSSTSSAETCVLANLALLVSYQEFAEIVSYVKNSEKHQFLNSVIRQLEKVSIEAVSFDHFTQSDEQVRSVQKMFDMLFSAIWALHPGWLPSNGHQLLTNVYRICRHPYTVSQHLLDDNVESIFVHWFIEPLVECSLQRSSLRDDYFSALTAFFSLEPVILAFSPDYDCLELMTPFLSLLVKVVERMTYKPTINTAQFKLDVLTVSKSEFLKDDILNLFYVVHSVSLIIQCKEFQACKNNVLIDRAFKVMCRLPLLSSMFAIPDMALRQSWELKIDARVDRISVPLINIYILSDPMVIKDFVFRVLWLGWTTKSQFENYCTSLFGVLSTTLIGDDLKTVETEEKLYRSTHAVSCAVEAICDLLVQTLLFPCPGNDIVSTYMKKQRNRPENQLFLSSKYGRQMKALKLLLDRNLQTSFTSNHSWDFVLNRNTYGIGQTSLHYLWSITGVLESSIVGDISPTIESRLVPSMSNYMMTQSTDLDISSTLKALLDTFEHWFSKDDISMILRNVVVRSLLFLTDMVSDKRDYQFIRTEMRRHLQSIDCADNTFDAMALFLLLKSTAVLGTDECDTDSHQQLLKMVDEMVVMGYESTNLNVLLYTLQGVSYVIQGYLSDELPGTMKSTDNLVLQVISNFCLPSDISTIYNSFPIGYEQVVFENAFRMMEEAVAVTERYKHTFLSLITKLYAESRLTCKQKDMLRAGIESLMIHSNIYGRQLLPTIMDCLSTCQLQPLHIRSTVSSYIVCVYKGLYIHSDTKASRIVDCNHLINIIAAFCSQPIGEELAEIVAILLSTAAPTASMMEDITKMLLTTSLDSSGTNQLLSQFDISLLTIFRQSISLIANCSKISVLDSVLNKILSSVTSGDAKNQSEYGVFILSLIVIAESQVENTSLWTAAVVNAFNFRQLKPVMRELLYRQKKFADTIKKSPNLAIIQQFLSSSDQE